MSISRVVIRLEIADGSNSVDFRYQATELEFDLSNLSYASGVSSASSLSDRPQQLLLTKEDIQIYKGRRDYHTITIETYNSAADIDPAEMMSSSAAAAAAAASSSTTHHARSPVDDTPNRQMNCPDVSSGITDTNAIISAAAAAAAVGSSENGDANPLESGKVLCKTGQKPSSSNLHFFSGNPAVETTEGILHLYKEDQMTSLDGEVPRSSMICMLNVPATLTSRDLIQYIAPIEPNLERIKIIRGSTPNEYMVLLNFRNQVTADEFFNTFNNKPFNSIEPEICHMVYVARVESLHSSDGASLQIPGATELPVCTVCLERMDESVDGILTILCNHSFHSSCLANWNDTSCPVCRYVQTPVAVADNHCFECDARENLWICLICGVVGCGRYANGHAYGHFQATAHTYSMQLGGNRVWDYAGDNYVHRLVQNKTDGKLVEVDEPRNPVYEEKIDSLVLEYTYLLTSQLESQRNFFEEKIQFIEKHKNRQIEEIEGQVKKVIDECTKRDQQVAVVTKEKVTAEKRCNQLTAKANKLTTELEEEREMNRCLRENQLQWQAQVSDLERRLSKKDEEMAELSDQLRDVMFYLEAKDKLEASEEVTQEELQEGQIVVQTPPSASAESSSGRRKKQRKKTR